MYGLKLQFQRAFIEIDDGITLLKTTSDNCRSIFKLRSLPKSEKTWEKWKLEALGRQTGHLGSDRCSRGPSNIATAIHTSFTALGRSELQSVHYTQHLEGWLQTTVYSVRIASEPSKVLQIVCGLQLRFLWGLRSGDLVPTTICSTLELRLAIRTLF